MINDVFIINKKRLYIYCDRREYSDLINNWIRPYNVSKIKKYDNYLKISNDETVWKISNKEEIIKGKLKHTDLYTLFYNIISNIVLESNSILIHSSVLCYNNIGVLILGDFNSGKTTLCLEGIKNNLNILSTDQSIISLKNNKLLLIKGSQYMKYEDKELFIDDNNDEIEIKYIINLVGMCDSGNLSFLEITNKDHIVKSLFKRITWHSDIPLFTSPIMLNIDRNKIFSFLSKINIPVYNARGDKESLINKIKEML